MMAVNNRFLDNEPNIKMADEDKNAKKDESSLNEINQNGRSSFNDTNQVETDYSSDEGIAVEMDEETYCRTNRFYERALAETKRMNSCVCESLQQQAKLREEFGAGIFSDWLQEHSQETLSSMPNVCLPDSQHKSNGLAPIPDK